MLLSLLAKISLTPLRALLGSLFMISLFFSLSPASAQPTPHIIGGNTAPPGTAPWMVAIVVAELQDSTEAQICGGTLIAGRYVLTAAHCVFDHYDSETGLPQSADPRLYKILHGSQTLTTGEGERVSVVGAVIHAGYNNITLEHDLALIKLADTLSPPYMVPASYIEGLNWMNGNTTATILGWGITSPNGPVLPTQLQEAKIPVRSDAQCLENLGRWYKPQSMLCGGIITEKPGTSGGINTCFGDSGGPLLVKDSTGQLKQLGITSWGLTGECAGVFYGVFSDVSAHEAFTFSRPVIAPIVFDIPTIEGAPDGYVSVGSQLQCVGGSFGGDTTTALHTSWNRIIYPSYSVEPISGANGEFYTPTSADIGSSVFCRVKAENVGGTTNADSWSLDVFDAVVDVTPTPIQEIATPIPTATPTPTPEVTIEAAIDTIAPALSTLALECGVPSCTSLVMAKDSESAVDFVTATVTQKVPTACRKGSHKKVCTRTLKRAYRLEFVSGDIWRATFPKRRNQKGNVLFEAVDSNGNRTSTVGRFKAAVK